MGADGEQGARLKKLNLQRIPPSSPRAAVAALRPSSPRWSSTALLRWSSLGGWSCAAGARSGGQLGGATVPAGGEACGNLFLEFGHRGESGGCSGGAVAPRRSRVDGSHGGGMHLWVAADIGS